MKKGWQTKTIGDMCEVIAGQSPEGKFYNSEGNGLPFYQGKKDFGEKFIEAPTTWTTQTTKVAKEGDILMSVRAPVGPVNFSTEEICIGRGLAAIRSGTQLNRDFLFYQLLHLQPEIAGKEGAVFASINKAEIEALPLAFATLAEQQRIVGLLDEAFEGLATAKANAEKNLQNARALFESHLQSVFTQRGPGWGEKSLVDVCTFINGRAYKKDEMLSVGKYPLLRVGNFFTNRDWYYSDLELDADKYCDNGDLLYAWSASFGPRVWDGGKVIYHYHIWKVLPHASVVEKRFLLHLLEWDVDEIKKAHGTGTTMMHVSKGSMESRIVPIPPLKEQAAIVSLLDDLREETQRLARLYERKHAALEALKKSLLHQAFTGEL